MDVYQAASSFTAELARFGPEAPGAPCSLAEAQAYCRRLAKTHYENFTVASWLLPRELRQPFYNVYAWCRWADDLADETGDAARSVELLDWWRELLDDCYCGEANHPVLVALRETIEQFEIPREPFLKLLTAFQQDQVKHRYETFDELLDYCRNSANPVGELVLRMGRCYTNETIELSDSICTGLQLANFWQDVARDFEERGRIYLPQESLDKHKLCDAALSQRPRAPIDPLFRQMMKEEVDRAEQFLLRGRPLVRIVPKSLQVDIDLFLRGGLAILAAIRRQEYDVWTRRPTVGKGAQLLLLAGSMRRRWFGG